MITKIVRVGYRVIPGRIAKQQRLKPINTKTILRLDRPDKDIDERKSVKAFSVSNTTRVNLYRNAVLNHSYLHSECMDLIPSKLRALFSVLPLLRKDFVLDLDVVAKGLWMVLIAFIRGEHEANRRSWIILQ